MIIILESFKKLESLQYFSLSYCGLNSNQLNILQCFISSNPQLKGLDFSGMKLTDDQLDSVLECIKDSLHQLEKLKLNDCSNTIRHNIITEVLRKFKDLQELELYDLKIIESFCMEFFQILISLVDLSILKLPYIGIPMSCCEKLPSILKLPLKQLEMGNNDCMSTHFGDLFNESVNFLSIDDASTSAFGIGEGYAKQMKSIFNISIQVIFNDLYKLDVNNNVYLEKLRDFLIRKKCSPNEYLHISLIDNSNDWSLFINGKYSFKDSCIFRKTYYINLKEIQCSNGELGTDFMDFFVDNLPNLSSLEAVDLTNNNFTNNDLEKLLNNLNQRENNIKILKIFNQNLTSEILINLSEKIDKNDQLIIFNSIENFNESSEFNDQFVNSKSFNISSVKRILKHFERN